MNKECPTCKGWGYTRACKPEYHFEVVTAPNDGVEYRQYVTDKQGSGCLECKGLGIVKE